MESINDKMHGILKKIDGPIVELSDLCKNVQFITKNKEGKTIEVNIVLSIDKD